MSLTLESTAAFLAEQAARNDGLSVSAWLSKFIHKNIHQQYPRKPYGGLDLGLFVVVVTIFGGQQYDIATAAVPCDAGRNLVGA
jgi:hypothetical protein